MVEVATRDIAQRALSTAESSRCCADEALEKSNNNALAIVEIGTKLTGISDIVREIRTDLKGKQAQEAAAIGKAAEAAMAHRTKVLVATIAAVGTIVAAALGILIPAKSSAQQVASQDNAIRLALDKVRDAEQEERRKLAEEVATRVLKKRDEQIDSYVLGGKVGK